MTGRIVSDHTKIKQSIAASQRQKLSTENRLKMSIAKAGKKQKQEHIDKRTLLKIGRKWWNNGITQIFNKECPYGWFPGRLKMNGKSTAGKKWWNNSAIRQLTEECPGEGWKQGKQL
jgi:hypothetical protein